MAGSDLGKCANITRGLLLIINIVFTLFGIIVLAIGIWAVVKNQDYDFVTGNSIISGGGLLIFCGIVTIIISVVGIFGAFFKLRPLLVVYAAIVFFIVILEVAAAIVAFLFSGGVESQVETRVFDAIDRYRVGSEDDPDVVVEEDVNNAIDVFQSVFDCCGWNNATDWIRNNSRAVSAAGRPPCPTCDSASRSDCATFNSSTVSFTTVARGCRDVSNSRLRVFGYTVGGLGIAFGLVEILGVLLALFLCCCITSARKQTVV